MPKILDPISFETAERPNIITPRAIELYLEENKDLYMEQVYELGKQYGGQLVTKKELNNGLMLNLNKYIREHDGLLPETIRPSNMPTEEFIPVRMTFELPAVGVSASKWYFFKRSRLFVLNPGEKT